MDTPQTCGKEKVAYRSRIIEIVKQHVRIGNKKVEFEFARRPPGVRLLLIKKGKVLLTKEFRVEHGTYDYRLPGGKVFDSIGDYHAAMKKSDNILKYATAAAKKECVEETGLKPQSIKHIYTSKAGATVIWDLFYFLVPKFTEGKQKLEEGEIIHPKWMPFSAAIKMCLNGSIHEDSSAAVLLRFLSKKSAQIRKS